MLLSPPYSKVVITYISSHFKQVKVINKNNHYMYTKLKNNQNIRYSNKLFDYS